MQRGVDGPGRDAMGPREFLDSDTPVTLDLGGDIGNESLVSDPPLGVETPLVHRRFPLLNFLHDVIDLRPLQGLVAIHLFDSFFNILETFPGDSQGANEITDRCHCVNRRG